MVGIAKVTAQAVVVFIIGLLGVWGLFRLTDTLLFRLTSGLPCLYEGLLLLIPGVASGVVVWLGARREQWGARILAACRKSRVLRVCVGATFLVWLLTAILGVPAVLAEQSNMAYDVVEWTPVHSHFGCWALAVAPFLVATQHEHKLARSDYRVVAVELSFWYGYGVSTLVVVGDGELFVRGVFNSSYRVGLGPRSAWAEPKR
jgi:hypothetical protein